MKNIFKGLINVKRIAIIIIVIAVIIIGFASAAYVTRLLDATNANNDGGNGGSPITSMASRNPGTDSYDFNMPAQIENRITSLITSSNIVYKENGSYKLNIDLDAKINELYADFMEDSDGRRTLNFLKGSEQEKKEYLKNMIRAEILTQYPDLRSALSGKMGTQVDSNEVQGVIQIKRTISDSIAKVSSIQKSSNTSLELKGVVCWGDQYTLGESENEENSYPSKLSTLLGKNVYNLGFEGETAEQILLRAGTENYYLKTSGDEFTIGGGVGSTATFQAVIVSDGQDTNQVFSSCDGSTDKKTINCTIGGAEGKLIYRDGNYIFTRTVDGDEETIPSETEISIETQGGYNDCIPIIWLGNNNKFTRPSQLVGMYKDILRSIGNPDDYIVIIPLEYEEDGTRAAYSDEEYSRIKNSMETVFSDRCIDLRGSGCSNPNDYDSISNIVQRKINALGFEIEGIEEQNPNAGAVEFNGTISALEEITLEYIPLGNKLEPTPGTLRWLVQHEDTNMKNAALQFFSIDASGNIVVANWNRTTTIVSSNEAGIENIPSPGRIEYSINTARVNYEQYISQYTMPFDYLWAFLIMGDDTEFVENLTNLALDSKITISLYDELTKVETDTQESHTEQTKTQVDVYTTEVYDDGHNEHSESHTSDIDSEDKYCNTNIIVETNKIRCKLTEADVWDLKYKVEGITATYYEGTPTSNPSDLYQQTIVTPPDEEWRQVSRTRRDARYNIRGDVEDPETLLIHHNVIIGTRYTTTYTTIYERTINQRTVTTIIKSGYKYNEGTQSSLEKTDKEVTQEEARTGEFSNPNFVKYYLYSKSAKNSISSIESWLYEALDYNGSTANMVDLTKYLIGKSKNRPSGISFSISPPSFDFIDLTDDVGNSDEDGGAHGTGGDGSIGSDSGQGYWGTYTRGGKTYKLYYQNYISASNNWGVDSNQMCVATAFAICHSGNGSTKDPRYFWDSRRGGAINGGMTQISKNASTITSYLNQNNPVIVYSNFGRDFFGSPHALVLLDVNSNGEVFVVNPYYVPNGNGQRAGGWYPLSTILSYSTARSNFAGSSGCVTLLR